LIGIPWMVAFALRADGWYLRQDIIWAKPNAMPSSVEDRCTSSHEYLFLLAKSERYLYDHTAILEPFANGVEGATPRGKSERTRDRGGRKDGFTSHTGTGWKPKKPGRNRRSVWNITTKPFHGAHAAVFPPELAEPCVLAGSRPGDTVLDPFMGSGTVAGVALRHGRRYLGCELNPAYGELHAERIRSIADAH
jgi:DNA modification methylase